MKFLPIENITYRTNLKEEEIIKRLSGLIKPEKSSISGLLGAIWLNKYEGEIIGHIFKIKRNKTTRENFLPRISGYIKNDFDGTIINVKMRLNTLITVFLYIWCSIYGIVFIVYSTLAIIELKFNEWLAISLVMLLFAYVSAMIGFKVESNKSKKDLASVFDAEIIVE